MSYLPGLENLCTREAVLCARCRISSQIVLLEQFLETDGPKFFMRVGESLRNEFLNHELFEFLTAAHLPVETRITNTMGDIFVSV